MAPPKPKRSAIARRRPAAAKPALHRLCARIATLANEHRLGAVGLAGAHANKAATADDAVELFVTVPFAKAEQFARAVAEATGRAVYLYDFHLVPWAHPLHLCVRWLNAARPAVRECPRDAVTRWRMTRQGQSFEATVRLESIPHFRAVDGPVAEREGEFMRVIEAPVLGGFLL